MPHKEPGAGEGVACSGSVSARRAECDRVEMSRKGESDGSHIVFVICIFYGCTQEAFCPRPSLGLRMGNCS